MGLSDHLVFHPQDGSFDLRWGSHVVLRGAAARVLYRDTAGQAHAAGLEKGAEPTRSDECATVRATDGTLELTWKATLADRLLVELEVANRGLEPIRLDELRLISLSAGEGRALDLGTSSTDWRFYQNGWQSWSAAFVRWAGNGVHTDPGTEEYRAKHRPYLPPAAPKVLTSEWFSVLANGCRPKEGGRALLFGFVTTKDQFGEVRLQLEGNASFRAFDVLTFADGIRLDPGEKMTSEKLLIAFGEDPLALLDEYAVRLGESMHARVPATPTTGWCTWYYFYGQNGEADVLSNVERIDAERLPLDVVLIDDGYQSSDGDWTSVDAEKYPSGMRAVAEAIKASGHVPGLWIAPFAVNEESQLMRDHPEFLLRDESRAPVFSWQHWNHQCYSLDLSRADVQAWLRQTFRTLVGEWGFEFFKLDFVYTGAAAGVHADPKMTRAQAVRRGLEIIREAVGDRPILGCGAPLGPSIGVVDAMRIGPDVSINWEPFFRGDLTSPSTAYAMRNTVTRSMFHGRLWQNDPDCVLVRRRDDDSALVLNEMRTMVSIIGLSGGAVLSSDNLPSIRRGRLKYLKQILPPTTRAARPLDLFEREIPGRFVLPVETEWGKWVVAAVVNWDDRTTQSEIPLAELGLDPNREYHAYNYWHRRYVGILKGKVRLARHQPHETRLLLFKQVARGVDLLSTTFHVAQGLVEVKTVRRERQEGLEGRGAGAIERVRVELEKQGSQRGQVLFTVPKGARGMVTRVNGHKTPHRCHNGILSVGLHLSDRAVVEVEVRTP